MKRFKSMLYRLYFFCFALSNTAFSWHQFATSQEELLLDEKEALFEDEMCSHCRTSKCGTVPYPSDKGHVTPDPILESPQVWSFVSEPNLHPMKVTVNTNEPGTSPGFIFVAPYAFSEDATYGQTGTLILDNEGNPLWFRSLSSPNLMNTDFRV